MRREREISNEIPEMSDLIESHKYTDTSERISNACFRDVKENERKRAGAYFWAESRNSVAPANDFIAPGGVQLPCQRCLSDPPRPAV